MSLDTESRPRHRDLARAIELWRENVLDLDIAADDARKEAERADAAHQAAIRERDRAVEHLRLLIEMAAKAPRRRAPRRRAPR